MDLRNSNLQKLDGEDFDVLIVGGGINGAVSAAALSAQGARVAIIDAGDFGGETSSHSSNLAWGGIKYLESWEFPLVWNLCKSRNHLMRNYPSTVREIRFLTTIEKGFRFHPLLVYCGSLLYWVMGRFATKPPVYMSRGGLSRREPRIDGGAATAGIEYSDCYLHDNDARFVFRFVRTAMDYGAIAANYVRADDARFENDRWHVDVTDVENGRSFDVKARVIVNACGPWVDGFNETLKVETRSRHAYSKGVHLLVDRVTEERRVLAFFASDGRLFFVIPMGPKTCIGTTDTRVEGPEVSVSEDDRQFILDNANEMLQLDDPITADDIIAERCGVRPLVVEDGDDTGDWVSLSRKHVVETDDRKRVISVFGGKLTDCLNVGEEVAGLCEDRGVGLPYRGRRWYGEPGEKVREEFFHQARLMGLDEMADPRASEPLSERFWRRYGRSGFEMLESIRANPDMAKRMIDSAEYLRCEILQTGRREMICKLDDFLRRRSKISLVVPREEWIDSDGLRDVCVALFGDAADEKLAEYKAMSDG